MATKDFEGNELHVGDRVVYAKQKYDFQLSVGTISDLTDKTIFIKTPTTNRTIKRETHQVSKVFR